MVRIGGGLRRIVLAAMTIGFGMIAGIGDGGAAEAVDLALVIATDTSRSIDEAEARLQREGVAAAFRHPQVIEAIQSGYHRRIGVAYIDWSSHMYTTVVLPWRIIDGAASADEYARALTEAPITLGQRTSISEGMDLAHKLLSDGKLQATRRVVDISGDGPNNYGRQVTEARDELVAKGITINGLPIINARDQFGPGRYLADLDDYYRGCVIGGTGAFIIVAKDFQDFSNAIRRKLIFEIAGLFPSDPTRPTNAIVPAAASDDKHFGSGFTYKGGCDAGERMWRREFDYSPGYR
jgi:hypothetical protein